MLARNRLDDAIVTVDRSERVRLVAEAAEAIEEWVDAYVVDLEDAE